MTNGNNHYWHIRSVDIEHIINYHMNTHNTVTYRMEYTVVMGSGLVMG